MAVFKYKARNGDGTVVAGLVEAPESATATRLLHDKKLFIIGVSEVKEGLNLGSILAKFKRVGFGDVVTFTRQLATMVTAGLSLPEALTILRAQTTNQAFVRVLLDMEHHIVGGGNLADALSKHSDQFSAIYISLVRAGESSGTLDTVLDRLADSLESQREFHSKVSGALVYPIIILVGMVAVVAVMMVVVIPKLSDLYRDFDIKLPWSTQLLIGISTMAVKLWPIVIIGVVGLSIGFSKWKKTPLGELLMDSLVLKLPLFGDLLKKIILVEFTRTMAMLITSGIHILEALRILKDSLGNVLYRNAIDELSKKVEKGFPLGETFAQYPIFPPIVSQMIKVGEETGKLDDALLKLSKYFQSDSEHLVKGLTTAIEPIIMVVLGLGVGFIVISIITPIYSLTSAIK
ncbi:hypothetical protein A2875_04665 [Candidatus Gottesmanbacteria bacterium RIFCSPHIGHO2_01_FULL_46_14]|uniref:Type II secretion system protein GspF domain-containing protein n=3 Tax=Candidatus Gottesmaniibacteriota TaxID=1752720 RepID=A0A1F5ZRB1_9BACT|nr:MAG: hypothetical protein UY08_C0012G0005 [Candidatus Gottesmanbacteria bacterium GW2011_GWA1_47_8]OGG14978.1 MAG: hypothetical protein A2875_04665 [Candidatus Gottesmanbacteria bacterium RIFCSPHIGHO2_01_FULL_46_14]OGG30051.1 MAG: hypothetical protein A2971_03975 [Candidatus Gottesmanbacteria bacterium RIFCSPLOWO2_01_FULL_46_21]